MTDDDDDSVRGSTEVERRQKYFTLLAIGKASAGDFNEDMFTQ